MELGRILKNRKIIIGIVILLLFQVVIFREHISQKEKAWDFRYGESYETGFQKMQKTHLEEYNEYIEGIIAQAEEMSGISIFSESGGFSEQNLQKTKAVFEKMQDVSLAEIPCRTIAEYFDFGFSSWMTLICLFFIVIEVSDVNRNGLRNLTFITRNGKNRLVIEKTGALLVLAFITTLIFQVTAFIQGAYSFGENPFEILSYPIQCVSTFAHFPVEISIGETLLIYYVIKSVLMFSIMLILWGIMTFTNNSVIYTIVSGGLFTLEYFLYILIDDTNVLKLFKYCNLFYLVDSSEFFRVYKNLSVFENAVGRDEVLGVFLLCVTTLSIFVVWYVFCTRYPCNSKVNALNNMKVKVISTWERKKGHFLEKLSLNGLEIYKTLVSRKVVVAFIFLFAFLIYRTDFTQIQKSSHQQMYDEFIEIHVGRPDVESEKAIEDLQAKLAKIDEDYENGLKEAGDNLEMQIEWSIWHSGYEEMRYFADLIYEQTQYIQTMVKERGIEAWYVNVNSYQFLLQSDDLLLNITYLFVMSWFVLATYWGEKGTKMHCIINSCVNREQLYQKKRRISYFAMTLIYGMLVAFQIITTVVLYGINGIAAPVQSIYALSEFRIECTIWQYFLGVYLLKYMLMLAVCYVLCKLLEKVCKGK